MSPSGANWRWSRLAAPMSSIMTAPAGTRVPWYSTSRVTYRATCGAGGSKRSNSSMAAGIHDRSEAIPRRLLIFLGNAQQHADHPHRHLRTQVGDQVEPAGSDQRIQTAGAEFADLRFEVVDLAWGEHPREQFAVDVVDRGILEQQHAGRNVDICLDQLENR